MFIYRLSTKSMQRFRVLNVFYEIAILKLAVYHTFNFSSNSCPFELLSKPFDLRSNGGAKNNSATPSSSHCLLQLRQCSSSSIHSWILFFCCQSGARAATHLGFVSDAIINVNDRITATSQYHSIIIRGLYWFFWPRYNWPFVAFH